VPLWSRPMARDKRCGRQGHQDRGDRGQYAPRLWPVWPVAISAVVVAGALAGGIYLGLLALAASRPGPNGGPASIDLLDIIKTTITVRVRRRRPRRRLRLPQAATRRGRRTPSNSPSGTRQPPTSLGTKNPLSASVVSTPWLDFVDGWDRPAGIYGRGRPAQRTVAMKWTADMSRATWHSCSKRADPRNRYLASWGKVRCRARARLSTFPTRFRWSRTGTHRYSDLRTAAGARLRCRDERSRLTPARTVTAAQTPANVSNRVP
jgi:hypothetical protein